MSTFGAFLAAIGLMLSPLVFAPRRERREIRGLVLGLWWVNASYGRFWHRLEVVGESTIPEKGPAILICNHTCCIDHILLQASTRRLLGFLIAKELYEFWLFRPLCRLADCIPVRRDGNDIAATKAALRALKDGRVVPIFPEGRITPTSGRELGEGKPGVAFIAIRAGVPVIPAYLWGTPETRKVVASYLTPSKARVRFGPAIDLSDFAGEGKVDRERMDEVTRRLMGAIRALRDEVQGVEGSGLSPRMAVEKQGGEGQRRESLTGAGMTSV